MVYSTEKISFTTLKAKLPLPDLLGIQIDSFKDFLQAETAPDQRAMRGLELVFRTYFPMESTDGGVVIEYVHYEIGQPKYPEIDCFDKNLSYAAPIKVVFRLIIRKTGEIKERDIYIGDFPLMTRGGTFIINGAERVVVNQIYKSPGVLFSQKSWDFSSKVVPEKGSWLEFIVDQKKDLVSVCIDSRRKIPVTSFLFALGLSLDALVDAFFESEEVSLSDVESNQLIQDLGGRYLAETIYDDEGNVLMGAASKLFPNAISDLLLHGKHMVRLITAESLLQNRAMLNTIEKDDARENANKAVKKVYSLLHPGEVASLESIKQELQDMFFSPRMYNIGSVGRYKLVLKLYPELSKEDQDLLIQEGTLSFEDMLRTLRYLLRVSRHEAPVDDIDHLGNRRVRTVYELLTNQLLTAFHKVERAIQEKLSLRELEDLSPQNVINVKPIVAALNDFFGMSQLSQFMDQTNPISELTHKRRLSALGPGGLSRERAGFEARDVHNTHYGRICPIETPEGPNIGLIVSLATFARVNTFGFLETPHTVVRDGQITDEVAYMSVIEEENHPIAQAGAQIDADGTLQEDFVQVLYKGEFELAPREKVEYIDVSSQQILSVSAALIPFIEHDDANRALMGSNMLRQAMPLLRSAAPIVGTGMEFYVARDSRSLVLAQSDGVVEKVDAHEVILRTDTGAQEAYPMVKFRRTNQDTAFNQAPIVSAGQKLQANDVIADGFASENGDLAVGQNVVVAFMPWNGYNYEDAVLLSDRVLKEDAFTSIYMSVFEDRVLETKLGPEEITREVPNVGEDALRHLDENGIVTVGAYVKDGDILMGKVTPKGETSDTPEFRLLHAIFGEKAKDMRDTSLRVPHGEAGTVVDVRVFSAEEGAELPPGVLHLVKVFIAKKRKIKPGDKIAGRHGNKGVVSRVLPEEDMPFLPDGRPVDVVLNPLGVPSRMNLGQLFETLLGYAGLHLGVRYVCEAFQGASLEQIGEQYDHANEKIWRQLLEERTQYGETEAEIQAYFETIKLQQSGTYTLRDGRTGEVFGKPVFVGVMYILKLHHMVDDKIHARSVGPYSLVTQQPLRGKANFGGQRLGEMEVWALEAYGATHLLQEMMTVKSDGTEARVRIYEGLIKGKYVSDPNVPESFKVLVQELRGLALDIQVCDRNGKRITLNEKEKETLGMKVFLV